MDKTPMIATSHLRKEYSGYVALENLSMEVARGDIYGLIGPNGAGKTTLLRILATLEKPTYGTVMIDGIEAARDPKAVHRRIGFMPDFHHAFQDMTVAEYLEYFASAHRLEASTRVKRLRHILELTQLASKSSDTVSGLSRGMKQRLCLGRTLLHDPELLLLDEPTSGLDPRARLEFRAIVKQLGAEGKTIVISSHILEDLSEFCNAVGILEKGRLVEGGRIASILARMRASTRLRIRIVSGRERAFELLGGWPGVGALAVSGDRISAAFSGDTATQADLLSALTAAGVKVAVFEEERAGLEEIFMQGSTHEVS